MTYEPDNGPSKRQGEQIMFNDLEKKYQVIIKDDSYFHPLLQKHIKQYAVYDLDGDRWECGLTYRDLQKELKTHAATFATIAAQSSRV